MVVAAPVVQLITEKLNLGEGIAEVEQGGLTKDHIVLDRKRWGLRMAKYRRPQFSRMKSKIANNLIHKSV